MRAASSDPNNTLHLTSPILCQDHLTSTIRSEAPRGRVQIHSTEVTSAQHSANPKSSHWELPDSQTSQDFEGIDRIFQLFQDHLTDPRSPAILPPASTTSIVPTWSENPMWHRNLRDRMLCHTRFSHSLRTEGLSSSFSFIGKEASLNRKQGHVVLTREGFRNVECTLAPIRHLLYFRHDGYTGYVRLLLFLALWSARLLSPAQ